MNDFIAGDRKDSVTRLSRRELLAATLATTGVASLATPADAFAQGIEPPASSRELWQWVRTQPVLDTQIAYLDSATVTPTWRVSMATEYRARESQSFDIASAGSEARWIAETKRLAARFAAFGGCDADEIVFTHGAGEALSSVANGLDLVAGDEVITTSQEHPASLSSWLFLARRRGIVVKQVDLPTPLTGPEQVLGLFAGAVTPRTRVFAFSHVQYGDGALLPAKELAQFARQRNIFSVVDGAQAFGMLDLNLRDLGCDFYAASFHKWLGGCQGSGMLYVRREVLDRLWPSQPRGIDASPPIFVPAESIAQAGVPATIHKLGNVVPHLWPALRGGEAALDMHAQLNRPRIEARVRELAIYARLRLQQIKGIELMTPGRPGLWAGILTVRAPGRAASEIADTLARVHRVLVRRLDWPGTTEGALRISMHIFNSHDDVERLLNGLQLLVRK
ncbi:MAG: aminotransferase class V-fold PLP-dependent enzyme [Steroidobacteraceae bacterium]